MANRNVTIDVGFSVNKSGLNDLTKSLDAVIQKAKDMKNIAEDYAEPYQVAAEAAQDLKNILNSSYNTKLGQLDLSKVNKQFIEMYGSISNLRDNLIQIGPEGARAFDKMTSSVLASQIPLKQTSTLLDKMSVTMANTVRFGISSSIFNNLTNSLSKAYGYVKNLDESLNNIRIVSGQSAANMEKFALQANAAASTLGSTTLQYTDAALIYYQQGLSDADIIERTNTTLKMANVLGESADNVSSYMTAIWNNFDNGSQSLEHFGDVITNLGAHTASSAEEIAEGLEKFASIGSTVGLSYEYATTALATVVAQTRQSADTVGTAFKTLFARIEGLKLGDTLDDGTTLNKYSEALSKVGIDIKDQNGQLKDMDNILNEMGNKWKDLSRDQQVALAQTVAGTRQYSQLVALMDNWDTFEINLGYANNSEGTLDKAQAVYMDSIEAKVNELQTSWESLMGNLFDEDAIKGLIGGLTKVVDLLNAFVRGLGSGTNTLFYLGSVATQVFSTQIGGGLARIKTNSDNAEKAMQAVINQQQILDMYKSQSGNFENNIEEGLSVQLEYMEKILSVREALSQEEYEALSTQAKSLAQEKAKLDIIDKIIREQDENGKSTSTAKAKNFFEKSDEAIKEIERLEELRSTVVNGVDEGFQNINLTDLLEKNKQNLEILEQELDVDDMLIKENSSLRLSENQRKILNEKILQTKENEAAIIDILNEYNETGKISAEDQQAIHAAILNILDDEIDDMQQQSNLYNRMGNIIKEYNGNLVAARENQNAQYQNKKRDLEIDIKKNQIQKDYTDLVRSASLWMSTLSSAGGLIKTLTNEDLSGWEKFTSILSVAGTQITLIATHWDDFIALGKRTGKAMIGLAAQIKGVSVAELTVGKAAKIMWAEVLGPVTAVIAAIAAITLAVYAYQKSWNAAAESAEKAKEYVAQKNEELQMMNDQYTKLKSSLDAYKKAEDALKGLKKGTQEWKEALMSLNTQVIQLMNTYPELLEMGAISKDEATGALTVTTEGMDAILAEQQRKVESEQFKTIFANISSAKANLNEDAVELVKTIENPSMFTNNQNKINMDDYLKDNAKLFGEILTKNADKLLNKDTSIQEFKNILSSNGLNLDNYQNINIEYLKNAILEHGKDIGQYSNSMERYTSQVGAYTQQLISSKTSGNEDYEESDYKKEIDSKLEKYTDEELNNIENELADYNYADMLGAYAIYAPNATGQIKYNNSYRWWGANGMGATAEYEVKDAETGEYKWVSAPSDDKVIKDAVIAARLDESYQYSGTPEEIIEQTGKTGDIINSIYGKKDGYSNYRSSYGVADDGTIILEGDYLPNNVDPSTVSTADDMKYMKDYYGKSFSNISYKPIDVDNLAEYVNDMKNLTKEDFLNKYSKEDLHVYGEIAEKAKENIESTISETKNKNDEYSKELDELINDPSSFSGTDEERKNRIENLKAYIKQNEDWIKSNQDMLDFGFNEAINNKDEYWDEALLKSDLMEKRKNEFGAEKAKKLVENTTNLTTGVMNGSITSQNIESNSDYNSIIAQMKQIKELYPELESSFEVFNNSNLVGTQEWYEALEKIQTATEDLNERAIKEKRKDAFNELAQLGGKDATEIDINAVLQSDDFEKQMDKLLDADYDVAINVHTDAENEFNQITASLNGMKEAAELISDDYKVSADNVRELAEVYPDILQNAKVASDGTIQLNKDIVKSSMDTAQAEVEANAAAVEEKLTNDAQELRAKQAQYQAMADAAMRLAQTDVEGSEEAATDKAIIQDGLNAMLEDSVNTEMEDQEKVATNSNDNAKVTAQNWNQAYQSAANSAVQFGKTAAAAHKAATTGNASGLNAGDFKVNYKGATGVSSEASQTQKYQDLLDGAGVDKTKYLKLAQGFQQAADSYGKQAADIEAMLYSIEAKTKETINGLKNAGKSKNSGKSSSKDENKYEAEEDRYQKVNEQLDQISRNLEKLRKQEERLLGGDLVKNLVKQIGYLNKEIDRTNEKLKIANLIKDETAAQLKGFGIVFDSDGIMQNYHEIWNQLYQNVDQDTFNLFEKLIDKYDETYGSLIPQLEQQIEDDMSAVIEDKIRIFDVKVELTLDLDEARKNWEDFKKNVLENIDDEDILGNAKYTFNRYKQIIDSGQIQTLSSHLLDTIAEGQNMKDGKLSNIFGTTDPSGKTVNDWSKWLEEAKTSIENLENTLTELDELQETLHDNLIDSLGETKEYMDSQTTLYDVAISNLQHNLKLVQLIYGENAYSEMSDYYSSITDTYQAEYNKAVSNTAYWKQLMETYVEGTDEWEAARDNWLASVSDEQAALESYMDALTQKYVNSINEIFDTLNNKITNGKGLEYINKEWNLINKQADMYLDTIDAQFGIQQLQNKYLDAIDKTNNVEIQQKLTNLMNEQVDSLKEQDKLSQYDLDRANKKYEIALKEIELQEAQMNKSTMRLRRDSQGNYTYQYAADEDKLAQLQDELSALKNELYNLDKDAYKENLNEIYSIWSEYQEKMAEAAQINDPEARLERETLLTEEYGEMINDLVGDNEELKQNLYESTYLSLVDLYGKESDAVHELENDQDATMSRMVAGWSSQLQVMADSIRDEGGFKDVYEQTLKDLEAQTIQYQAAIDDVKTKLEEEQQAQTNVDNTLKGLITTTDEFIQQAQNATSDIEEYIEKVQGIQKAYEGVSEAAKQALIDANSFVEGVYKENIEGSPNGVSDITNQINTQNQSNNSTPEPEPVVQQPQQETNPYASYRLGGQEYTIKRGDTLSAIAKRFYGKASLYTEIWKNNKDHMRGKNANQIWPGEVIRLNTGGYTGDWSGNDGRMAMLHKKELVLNATDTSNILSAIAIMREMTQSMLGNKISASAFGGIGGNGLEQNVHIEATFPNVTSHTEIEEALNNLVNVAAQRVQEK